MIQLLACLILLAIGTLTLKDLGKPPKGRPDPAHFILFGAGVVVPYGAALVGLIKLAL